MAQEFASNVVVANEYTLLGIGSVYERLTVGVAAIEVKAGVDKLAGRTTITVQAHPDNTGVIFLGLDNTVTANHYFYCLSGGSAITLRLDSVDNISIYAIASVVGQIMGVIEGKSA